MAKRIVLDEIDDDFVDSVGNYHSRRKFCMSISELRL